MYPDHEFDPVCAEEQARAEQDEEFRRRVRNEVLRVQRGEADEEIRADQQREQAEKEEKEQAERKEQKRNSGLFRGIVTGGVMNRLSGYYGFLGAIAGMFFVSIVVFFTALHYDRQYALMERETQMLRERSIRLQEQRYRITTHSAIVERLRERGIDLRDPSAPGERIEN